MTRTGKVGGGSKTPTHSAKDTHQKYDLAPPQTPLPSLDGQPRPRAEVPEPRAQPTAVWVGAAGPGPT